MTDTETTITEQTPAEKIAELNDLFRKGDRSLGIVTATTMVKALSPERQRALFRLIRNFDNFEPGNDPYGEHDFGRVDLDEEGYFFKIDYYDQNLEGGSEDPSDIKLTKRVMTIMHRSEY